MQDYTKYNYRIRLDDLAETIRKADRAGYPATVIINGEYYTVETGPDRAGTEEER